MTLNISTTFAPHITNKLTTNKWLLKTKPQNNSSVEPWSISNMSCLTTSQYHKMREPLRCSVGRWKLCFEDVHATGMWKYLPSIPAGLCVQHCHSVQACQEQGGQLWGLCSLHWICRQRSTCSVDACIQRTIW